MYALHGEGAGLGKTQCAPRYSANPNTRSVCIPIAHRSSGFICVHKVGYGLLQALHTYRSSLRVRSQEDRDTAGTVTQKTTGERMCGGHMLCMPAECLNTSKDNRATWGKWKEKEHARTVVAIHNTRSLGALQHLLSLSTYRLGDVARYPLRGARLKVSVATARPLEQPAEREIEGGSYGYPRLFSFASRAPSQLGRGSQFAVAVIPIAGPSSSSPSPSPSRAPCVRADARRAWHPGWRGQEACIRECAKVPTVCGAVCRCVERAVRDILT